MKSLRHLLRNRAMVRSAPKDANAVDLFRGEWVSEVPVADAETGNTKLFSRDQRPAWAATQLGSLQGFSILELGPMEGGHSYQLEGLGARSILAIESNKRLFLRCLVVKNALNLRTKFLLGDFVEHLRTSAEHYDLIFASGVLYHMPDPMELIYLMTLRSDRIYLWTHYYDHAAVMANAKLRIKFALDRAERVQRDGFSAVYHRRNYGPRLLQATRFIGGVQSYSTWLERQTILDGLEHFGFNILATQDDDSENPNGPSLSIAAVRASLESS